MAIYRDGALQRRMRALETRLESTLDAESRELELPPLVLPRGEQPTEEREWDGVPDGYMLFVLPAKNNDEPDPGKRMWLRSAFRS